jgi:hypothetical protein
MRVAVHEAGHEHRAAAFHDFVASLGHDTPSDGDNLPIDAHISRRHAWWIELNKQRIAKKSTHENLLTTEHTEGTETSKKHYGLDQRDRCLITLCELCVLCGK